MSNCAVIVRSPDVRGGHARIEGTRIGVHDVIGLLQNGETIDSLTTTCLPMLTKAQIYECLAYIEVIARQMMRTIGNIRGVSRLA